VSIEHWWNQAGQEADLLKCPSLHIWEHAYIVPIAGASRQFWAELLAWETADGTAIVSTATETIIFPNKTIPANFMADGRVLELKARGRWGNVVTAVPTMTFFIRWGGVAGIQLAASPAIVTPAAAVTAGQWSVHAYIQTRLNGATGTLFVQGIATMFEDAAATFGTVLNYGVAQPMGSAGVATPAAVTVDLTADTALTLSAKWSASDAANTLTGHIYLLKALN
jgi:hypothetical protein